MAADESWAQFARDTRDALAILGRPIDPKCLPDEPEACGGSFAQHSAAHLAEIKAIADCQLGHLGPGYADLHSDVYWRARTEMGHGPGEGFGPETP